MALPTDVNKLGSFKGLKGDTGSIAYATAETVPWTDGPEVEMIGPEEARGAHFKIPLPLPGPATVNNDDATELLLLNPTKSQAALRTQVRGLSSSVNVKSYGADGGGTPSDSAAVAAAISSAQALGISTVVFDAGGTYRLTEPIKNNDRSLRIDATDAVILADHSGAVVEAMGQFSASVPVSAVELTTRTNAVDGASQNVVKLTVPAGLGWKVGDIAVFAADDVIVGSRDSGSAAEMQNRVGTFMTVIEQDGTTLYCAGTLDDPYTTNMRIAKLNTEIAFSWTGGTIKYTDAAFANFSTNVFSVMRLFAPTIEGVTIPRIRRSGIYVRSCLKWMVRHSRFMYGTNDLSVPAYGYGILNEGSAAGVVDSCFFTMLRHGYTNGSGFRAPGSSDVDGYGRPTGTKVIDCFADSCTAQPYDSHTQGLREQFINCTAINSSVGFGLRGIEHRILNAVVQDCTTAVSIFGEGTGGLSYGHVIDGMYASNCGTVLSHRVNYTTGHVNFEQRDARACTVINVVSLNQRSRIATLRNATLVISNWRVQYAPIPTTNEVGVRVANSNVTVRDVRLNVRSINDTLGALISFAFDGISGALGEADVQDVSIINNGVTAMPYLAAGGSAAAYKFRARGVTATNPPATAVTQYAYGAIPRTDITYG